MDYKAIIIKTLWYPPENRPMEQKRESRNKCLHLFTVSWCFDKGAKNTQGGKASLPSKWCWKTGISTYISLKLDPSVTPYTKTNSKCIKGLNIRPGTVKPLEENRRKISWHWSGQWFFWIWSNSTSNKSRKRQMGTTSNQKASVQQRKQVNRIKQQSVEQQKIFANYTSKS